MHIMKGHIFLYSIFLFLNIDISLTIHVIELKFSKCILKIGLEEIVSQIFYLGPSFHFM